VVGSPAPAAIAASQTSFFILRLLWRARALLT
jgi:hypothetical protein